MSILAISCGEKNNSNLHSNESSETNTTYCETKESKSYDHNSNQKSSRKTKTAPVKAEVFHILSDGGNFYYKDANRKETIYIDIYDNGFMSLQGNAIAEIEYGAVYYSRLNGYEYECFDKTTRTIYAFNNDDLYAHKNNSYDPTLDPSSEYFDAVKFNQAYDRALIEQSRASNYRY